MEQTTIDHENPKPRWQKAQSKEYVDTRLMRTNRQNLALYYEVIKAVKTQFITQYPELTYERDYTKYPVEDIPAAVHCFMTKTFYWYLACGECYDFNIHYNFSDCPFEVEILAILQPFSGSPQLTLFNPQPNLVTAFKRTSRLEESKFFKAW